ncbi:MAG: class I SAM-dependent RNA methyltransferase [Candidatus Nanoarchaeia archaeon]
MTSPKCAHFPTCGGCSLQHIPYELTLENKRQFLADQLRKNKIPFEGTINVFHGKEYGYRNRMDFVFFSEGLGLREKGSFEKIIKIKHCEIANERVNALKKEVEEFFQKHKYDFFNLKTKRGTMKYALIRASDFCEDSCISFALNSESKELAEHIDKIKEFAETTTANNIMISRVAPQRDDSTSEDYFTVKGTEYLQEEFLGKKLLFHSQGFFQNNSGTAQMMVERARKILEKYNPFSPCARTASLSNESVSEGSLGKDREKEKNYLKDYTLLDSYGGVGTFGICLADLFKKTVIVENYKQSIDCAKMNIKDNNIANAEAFVLDSAKISKVVQKGKLVVVNDPPRSGMSRQAIDALMMLEPEVIIYISCNPSQFAKEMILFQKKYEIKALAVFDMFPQTNHIESMAELVKK